MHPLAACAHYITVDDVNLGKICDVVEKVESMMERMTSETSNKVVTAWLQAAAIIAHKVRGV